MASLSSMAKFGAHRNAAIIGSDSRSLFILAAIEGGDIAPVNSLGSRHDPREPAL
jgi:hypothetical protein